MFRAGQSPQIAKNLYLLYRRNETKRLDFQFTKSLAIRGEQQLSLSLSLSRADFQQRTRRKGGGEGEADESLKGLQDR